MDVEGATNTELTGGKCVDKKVIKKTDWPLNIQFFFPTLRQRQSPCIPHSIVQTY